MTEPDPRTDGVDDVEDGERELPIPTDEEIDDGAEYDDDHRRKTLASSTRWLEAE